MKINNYRLFRKYDDWMPIDKNDPDALSHFIMITVTIGGKEVTSDITYTSIKDLRKNIKHSLNYINLFIKENNLKK